VKARGAGERGAGAHSGSRRAVRSDVMIINICRAGRGQASVCGDPEAVPDIQGSSMFHMNYAKRVRCWRAAVWGIILAAGVCKIHAHPGWPLLLGAGGRRGPAAALLPNDTGKIVPLVLSNRACLTYTQSWVSWLSHAELGLHWSHRTAVRCTPPRAAHGASSGARGSPHEHEGTKT